VLTDARTVLAGSVLRADVCIVGAGAAGIALARRMRGTGRRVALLESGGFEPDAATQALCRGALTGEPMGFFGAHPGIDFMRIRQFGGSTNHWGGWCRPLDPADFEVRDLVPDSGWPFARDALDPWYADAQAVCQLGPFEYEAAYWIDREAGQPVLETEQLQTSMFQLSPPTHFGDVYRDELVNADDVELCLWANVVDLPLAGDRVAAATVATLTGNQFRVEAATFVLATGGIEVPRLLLACNRDRPAGVGNAHDLVGRYFADHPHLTVRVVFSRDDLDLYLVGDRDVTGVADGGVTSIRTAGALVPAPDAAAARKLQGLGALFDIFVDPDSAGSVSSEDAGGYIDAIVGSSMARQATLEVRAEPQPNPTSRVMLTGERDALGMPLARVDWQLTADDRRSIDQGLALIADELAGAGIALVRTEIDGVGPLDRGLDVGCHHMGTARMHVDPERGVVDADGRVHDVLNLYVAGSAVFPTFGWVNPTLTIVALALRLGDHLADAPE
jgi:choline dehydrogenase-like flavoprotein